MPFKNLWSSFIQPYSASLVSLIHAEFSKYLQDSNVGIKRGYFRSKMWISKTRGGHSCPQNDKIPLPWACRGLNNSGSLPRWLFKHSFDDELEKTEHCRSIATSMHDDTSVLAPYTHNASSYRRFTITFPARDVPSAVKGEMDENVLSGFTALPSRNTGWDLFSFWRDFIPLNL